MRPTTFPTALALGSAYSLPSEIRTVMSTSAHGFGKRVFIGQHYRLESHGEVLQCLGM